jgi:hypothetical protein
MITTSDIMRESKRLSAEANRRNKTEFDRLVKLNHQMSLILASR